MFIGEKALSAWCKVIDACGDVFMTAFRDDCLAYIAAQNGKFQRQLEDQTFFDLFLGGIFKLDLLNATYQRGNTPKPKPRLNGVFLGQSQVSPTISECITADLIKLARDREARSEFPILNMVPNTIPRISKTSAPSPTPSSGRSSCQGGQLEIAFPSGSAVLQGTELQLGGGLRSAMSPTDRSDSAARAGRMAEYAGRNRPEFYSLPPAPRKAGIWEDSGLLSGEAIRFLGAVALFKSEPPLKGECTAYYVRDTGCTWGKCNYRTAPLKEAASTDPRDLAQALRRAVGSSSARNRPGTPGGRRERSDSAGSAASVGSQFSDGGVHKPKQRWH
jgi:hypothetical protein